MSNDLDLSIEFINSIARIKSKIENTLRGMKSENFMQSIGSLNNARIDDDSLFEMMTDIYENTTVILSIISSEHQDYQGGSKLPDKSLLKIFSELNTLYTLLQKIVDINLIEKGDNTYYLLVLGVLNKTQSLKFEVIFSNKFSITTETTDKFIKATQTINEIQTAGTIIKNYKAEADELITQMRLSSAAVSREGLTKSFKDSVNALSKSIKYLDVINYFSIACMFFITLGIIGLSIFIESKESMAYERFLLITPLVFLSWFVSKRSQFLYQIKEEYSYKYATALAYEGYKDEISKQNSYSEDGNKMRDRLIEITIENLSRSPLEQFDKNSDHAPYAQFIRKFENKQSS